MIDNINKKMHAEDASPHILMPLEINLFTWRVYLIFNYKIYLYTLCANGIFRGREQCKPGCGVKYVYDSPVAP